MTIKELTDMGYHLERIVVENNVNGARESRWLMTLNGKTLSFPRTQGDAVDRLVILCQSF